MKKLFLVLSIAAGTIAFAACGNNNGGNGGTSTDSSTNAVKPADNNAATNPSMADTGFSKNNADTANRRKDSTNNR